MTREKIEKKKTEKYTENQRPLRWPQWGSLWFKLYYDISKLRDSAY